MQITLHEAARNVADLLEQLDPETGELPAEFDQARAVVATKATAVAAYIVESDRQITMVEDYAKELMQRVKTAKKRADWLRQYLREHMAAAGITEITDERGVFRASLQIGRDEAVEVFDEQQLPQDYLREIPAKYEPDKTLIKRAMKDGHDVPGAKLVKRDRLVIR